MFRHGFRDNLVADIERSLTEFYGFPQYPHEFNLPVYSQTYENLELKLKYWLTDEET